MSTREKQPDRFIRGASNIARVVGCSRRDVFALMKRDLLAWKVNGPTSRPVARRSDLMAWREREIEETRNREKRKAEVG